MKHAGVYCAVAVFFCLGILTTSARSHSVAAAVRGEAITAEGTVRSVRQTVARQEIELRVTAPYALAGRLVSVSLPRYPELATGKVLRVACASFTAASAGSPWLQRAALSRGVDYQCAWPTLEGVSPEHAPRAFLNFLSSWSEEAYRTSLREPERSLVTAMVLNRGGELSSEVRNDFSRSGIIHIVSISGLHMTLIAFLLEALLGGLGIRRVPRLIILAVFLISYLALLGVPEPALRAVIMLTLLLAARVLGRPGQGLHLVVVTAALMVAFDPRSVSDIGFQLSFLSLAGIVVTGPLWERVLMFIPEQFALRRVVSLTLGAQTLTVPLTAFYFGTISVIAPVANLAAVPLSGVLLISAFLLPFLSLLPGGILLAAGPVQTVAATLIAIAKYCAILPFSWFAVPQFSPATLLLSYTILGVLIALTARYGGINTRLTEFP